MKNKGSIKRMMLIVPAMLFAALVAVPNTANAVALCEEGPYATAENGYSVLGERRQLLKTFANPDAALAEFRGSHPDFIEEIDALGLPELSAGTAYDYKMYAISTEQDSDIIEFLDIYENQASNDARAVELEAVNKEYERGALSYDQAVESAWPFLPLDAGPSLAGVPSVQASFNLTAAKNYTAKYAYTANTTYGIATTTLGFEADCTNYASQILYAAGIPMDTYSSAVSGWWWKTPTNRSISWIQAATFARYMGSGYNSTYWSSLVSNVQPGDFIGYDAGADGDMDHIGFVYDKSGSLIKIAQHTTNYLKWSSDTGWPSMQNGTTRFYRIRR